MTAIARRALTLLLHPAVAVAARVILGGVFAVSGTVKLIEPVENFMAAIHAYDLLPVWMERPLAVTLPWVEMGSGVLLVLGLLTRASVMIVALQLAVFTVALGSTLLRGISLEDCGCFGALGFKESNTVAFVRNLVLLALAARLGMERAPSWALDRWLQRPPL
ncbi:MAG: DoxX family membrane protein [Nitrospirae bacterium]|nr:DoxX family membrane protein [Nitrospirota bacterium]